MLAGRAGRRTMGISKIVVSIFKEAQFVVILRDVAKRDKFKT